MKDNIYKEYLSETKLLDFSNKNIQKLILDNKWNELSDVEKVKSSYNFTKEKILFGYNKDDFVRLSGAMAVGSCAGVLFSMAFDNVVSYSQQCFVFPFLFIGIFLKAIDLCKDYNNRFV